MNIPFRHYFSFILILSIVTAGCSSSQKSLRGDDTDSELLDSITGEENLTPLQRMLAENRSRLSDVYSSLSHDIPDIFQQEDSSDASLNKDPFDGYRVQIISTRDKPLADSVAHKFRTWADSTIQGYTARAYVFFRQPFYKVHIGDFQEMKEANSFSRLIKRRYPDAWVVHDRINPSNVPADTTTISFKTFKESNSPD